MLPELEQGCAPDDACVCVQMVACVSEGRFGVNAEGQHGRYEHSAAASEPGLAESHRREWPGALESKGEARCKTVHPSSNSNPGQVAHPEDQQESSRLPARIVFACVCALIRKSEHDVETGSDPK